MRLQPLSIKLKTQKLWTTAPRKRLFYYIILFMENEKERLKLLEALIEEGKEFELEPLSFDRYKFCKAKENTILANGLQAQQNGEYVVFVFDDCYGEKLILGYSTKCGRKAVRT